MATSLLTSRRGTLGTVRLPAALIDLDANSISGNNGDAVSSFPDVSGNARHFTQSTSGNKPSLTTNAVNGRNAVRFNQKFMTNTSTGISGQTSFTLCLVMAVHSVPAQRGGVLVGEVSSALGNDFDQASGNWAISNPASTSETSWTSVVSSGSLVNTQDVTIGNPGKSFGTFAIVTIVAGVDGTAVSFYTNGGTATTTTGRSLGSVGLAALYLGTRVFGGAIASATAADFSLARMRLHSGRLSSTDRNAVHTYLGGLYGITVT